MLPAFGFSVGDFVAALELLATVIDALRESGDSTTQCRSIIRQLIDLETALIHVRRLEFDEAQAAQMYALRQSAAECRTTIDEFLVKIRKYQPHLSSQATSTPQLVKQSWYKIRWALCRKEDLERFKADLSGHTEAINILMNAIQLDRMTLDAKSQVERYSVLKLIVQDCFSSTVQRLASISTGVATSVANSKKLLDIVMTTARLDCRIFAMVLDMHGYFRTAIAPQIMRSQPVYFIDALGTPAPFHLEFIRSAEAFLFVLRDNLKDHESATKRIDRGEFVISDVATKRDIDLRRAWNVCFRPGQRVDMSMVMSELYEPTPTCPSCKAEYNGSSDDDITCSNCGLIFRRVTELESAEDATLHEKSTHRELGEPDQTGRSGPERLSESGAEDDVADELLFYRKVRLRQLSVNNQAIEATAGTGDEMGDRVTYVQAISYVEEVKVSIS